MRLDNEFLTMPGATASLQEVESHPADSRRGKKKSVVLGECFQAEQC